MDSKIVFIDITAEVCRIVRVDRDAKVPVKHLFQVVLFHRRENPQLDVGERAYGKWSLRTDKFVDKHVVFHTVHTMIDPGDMECFQRLPDIVGMSFFSRVCDSKKSFAVRTVIELCEFVGRVAEFRGVEADAGDDFLVVKCLLESFQTFGFTEVAENT